MKILLSPESLQILLAEAYNEKFRIGVTDPQRCAYLISKAFELAEFEFRPGEADKVRGHRPDPVPANPPRIKPWYECTKSEMSEDLAWHASVSGLRRWYEDFQKSNNGREPTCCEVWHAARRGMANPTPTPPPTPAGDMVRNFEEWWEKWKANPDSFMLKETAYAAWLASAEASAERMVTPKPKTSEMVADKAFKEWAPPNAGATVQAAWHAALAWARKGGE